MGERGACPICCHFPAPRKDAVRRPLWTFGYGAVEAAGHGAVSLSRSLPIYFCLLTQMTSNHRDVNVSLSANAIFHPGPAWVKFRLLCWVRPVLTPLDEQVKWSETGYTFKSPKKPLLFTSATRGWGYFIILKVYLSVWKGGGVWRTAAGRDCL